MRRASVYVLAVALLASVPSLVQAQAPAKRGDRNTITRVDIDEAGTSITNAQDAVQRLRPNWLRQPMGRMARSGADGQAGEGASEPILYIDERRQPNLEQLRTVPVVQLLELKYLDQNRAIQMLGPGHEMGAILITTRKSP